MITLENDELIFSFPDVHPNAHCSMSFQRTLRIPDDGNEYPLPAGLGQFPLRHVDDYAEGLDDATLRRGGIILPMHQTEATWLNFSAGGSSYPFAIKVAAGKINAVTGAEWTPRLSDSPQDYIVIPTQPWLDGFAVAEGVIRQFVASKLGEGYSVEEQLTGSAEHGGLQIIAYPMKAGRYRRLERRRRAPKPTPDASQMMALCCESPSMGMAAGGRMRQHIYADRYGIDAWDQDNFSRCFVTIAPAEAWEGITGEPAPDEPISTESYTNAGTPWFDYENGLQSVAGSDVLASVKSLAELKNQNQQPLDGNESLTPAPIRQLGKVPRARVREFGG